MEMHKKIIDRIKKLHLPMYITYDPVTLSYTKVSGVRTWTRRIITWCGFAVLGYVVSPGEILLTNHVEYENVPMIIKQDLEFSEDRLWQLLAEMNVRFPHIVVAQARIESGHYRSKIFRTNNNLFGMKISKGRCTTHKGTQYGHALYTSWQESVIDYAFFQTSYLRDLKSESQYYEYLGAHYAEAGDTYTNMVRSEAARVMKKYENWEGPDSKVYNDSISDTTHAKEKETANVVK